MDLADAVSLDQIQVGTKARDKFDVLREIARLARKSPILAEYSEEVIFEALDTRERIGSTGFGAQVAIPHCTLEEIDDFVVGVLIAPQGVDFESLDGGPTRLFFFIIGPEPERNKHIRILSAVSRALQSPELVQKLCAASGPQEVHRLLSGRLTILEPEHQSKTMSMFNVIVQREEYFDSILELFASVDDGSVVVIETSNASSYLHTMPLYSAFWNESVARPGRIIVACVDRALCNDIVRRINMIAGSLETDPGVMITIHDLSYVSGSLDF